MKVRRLNMKILLYNWTQFDEKDGGGVTVYLDNIIRELIKDKTNEVYFISSGSKYNLFRKKTYIKRTKNKYGNKVNSYTIYNSPTMMAGNFFDRIDIFNEDKLLYKILLDFVEKVGPFDVIHFNNLEGLSAEVLKLKGKYPKTKFIYSMHNYFPICPNGYLWQHNKVNCKDYQMGIKCQNCINSNYNLAKKKMKIKTLLDFLKIDLNSKIIKTLKNRSHLNNSKFDVDIKDEKRAKGSDYKKFRENNVRLINKYIDDVLCVSQRVYDIAVNTGISKNKCHVSYIGTKFANNLQRQNIDINSKEFNLIYLGYMNPMKGFDFLVNALNELGEDVSKNVNLFLVCRNNNSYNIDKIIARLEKKFNSVTYIDGYTHDTLPQLLNGKHLGIIPVVWEDNLPQVSIEITSFGVPILSSNLGGASELCSNNDFKFKGGNKQDFIKKLTNIINNRNLLISFWDSYNKPNSMVNHMKDLLNYYKS